MAQHKKPRKETVGYPVVKDEPPIHGLSLLFDGTRALRPLSSKLPATQALLSQIYDCGTFGKGTLSRSRPEFRRDYIPDGEEVVAFSLEEGFYLFDVLQWVKIVVEGGPEESGKFIECEEAKEVWDRFSSVHSRFPFLYAVYSHYRRGGFIPRSGLKFGCDYAIYEDAPEFCHAIQCVHIAEDSTDLVYSDLLRRQRTVEGVHKVRSWLPVTIS